MSHITTTPKTESTPPNRTLTFHAVVNFNVCIFHISYKISDASCIVQSWWIAGHKRLCNYRINILGPVTLSTCTPIDRQFLVRLQYLIPLNVLKLLGFVVWNNQTRPTLDFVANSSRNPVAASGSWSSGCTLLPGGLGCMGYPPGMRGVQGFPPENLV